MKLTLKLEELGMFILGIYLFTLLNYTWWWFLVLLLLPDIGMIGYAFNNKIGAFIYNVFHHKGIAIFVYLVGCYFQLEVLKLIGVILFSHSAMDRIFGYGLKFIQGFKHTHLGKIGKE